MARRPGGCFCCFPWAYILIRMGMRILIRIYCRGRGHQLSGPLKDTHQEVSDFPKHRYKLECQQVESIDSSLDGCSKETLAHRAIGSIFLDHLFFLLWHRYYSPRQRFFVAHQHIISFLHNVSFVVIVMVVFYCHCCHASWWGGFICNVVRASHPTVLVVDGTQTPIQVRWMLDHWVISRGPTNCNLTIPWL